MPMQKMLCLINHSKGGYRLTGPIHSQREAGHTRIVPPVDYATRYSEAIPMKVITTEALAERLVGIYSRVRVPQEILSDSGTQFV